MHLLHFAIHPRYEPFVPEFIWEETTSQAVTLFLPALAAVWADLGPNRHDAAICSDEDIRDDRRTATDCIRQPAHSACRRSPLFRSIGLRSCTGYSA